MYFPSQPSFPPYSQPGRVLSRGRHSKGVVGSWESVDTRPFEYLQSISPAVFKELSESMKPLPSDVSRYVSLAAVNDGGVEILAHYKSFRYLHAPPYPGYWGIFINGSGIRLTGNFLNNYYLGKDSFPSYLYSALLFLYRHELFHFNFDKWVLSHEEIRGGGIYDRYLEDVYRPYRSSIENFEETLANMIALTLRGYQRSHIEGLRSFAREMPSPYANIDADIEDVAASLAGRVLAYGGPSIASHDRLRWQGQLILNRNAFKGAHHTPPAYLVERFTLQ